MKNFIKKISNQNLIEIEQIELLSKDSPISFLSIVKSHILKPN